MLWWKDALRCPVCGEPFAGAGQSLVCTARHCYDVAKEGYVNFAPANAAGGGDDATLISARTAFLSRGFYAPIAERVDALLTAHGANVVMDAGCGEGYYTCRMARGTRQVFGFDLSKRGVRTAAKAAKKDGLSVFFAVASVFDLPVADGTADAVVSLFAPVAEAEFCRVLRPGGILIFAGAGKRHLWELKRVLYDTPVENAPRADAPHGMTLLSHNELTFEMDLDGTAARDLFAMTPYYYRTPEAGRARLAALDGLACTADVSFDVYRV